MLLALLGSRGEAAVDGDTLLRRLERGGRVLTASAALTHLVRLESSGHVRVDRSGGHYRFRHTALGEEAAYALGPGDPIDVVLVMVDLVGFVQFTAEHGDSAAHHAARALQDVGETELRRSGGKLVKPLGDGFLGTVRSPSDAIESVRAVARQCVRPDGHPWDIRASAHRGQPIAYRGDLFGGDVNLASRLCECARPRELVCTAAANDPTAETIAVRGLREPVSIRRIPVP